MIAKNTEQCFVWEEIKRHTSRDDCWIVIENNVYNVTEWQKRHPGGSKVLRQYAGQDATEAYRAFHTDLKLTAKFLAPLKVGTLVQNNDEDKSSKTMKDDFEELRQICIKQGLFNASFWFFFLMALHIILLEITSVFILYRFGNGWLPMLVSVICFTVSQGQADWLQHDLCHVLAFKSLKLHRIVHNFWMNFFKGLSYSWYNEIHQQHHSKTNVIGKDHDINTGGAFVIGEEMAKMAAKRGNTFMPYHLQHIYFLIAPSVVHLIFSIRSLKSVIVRRKYLELLLIIAFYARISVLYLPVLGIVKFIKFAFITWTLESNWVVWIFAMNHIPMEISTDKEKTWLSMHLDATCNVEKSLFNDWFTGHLNFQIEHHLFPTMPRHNLHKVTPLVKSLCSKHNLPFIVKPFGQALVDILRTLKYSGDFWKKYHDVLYS